MKELGQFLKSKREEKKVTLEEVSVATKIGIKVLQSIEEGDLDRLPPKPFVRGFIQSYAKYLGLDVREVLDMYQKATGTTPPPPTLAVAETTKKIERSLPGGARNIITVTLIIVLIIAIVVVQRMISKREAEMHGEVSAITGNAEPLSIKPSPSPEAFENAGASPVPNLSPVLLAMAGSSPVSAATSTPLQAPVKQSQPEQIEKPTPTPLPVPSPVPSPSPVLKPTPKPAPSVEPTPVPEQIPQEVIVEALDKVTLKITIDGKAEQEVTLNPDQIQTFKAKGKIKIFTPDGGAISIIQNGFDLGVPGNLGQPKTMVFPK